jgi:CIC family chloride channel protein
VKPAFGGLLLGVLALLYPLVLGSGQAGAPGGVLPEIFGSGFDTIEGALQGKLPFALLFALIFLKPLATSFTLGSGNSGGVFAPSLFTGAALGGAFGWGVEYLFPGATAGTGAFAIVGMAAVFAGAAHAPFTAIFIVFEMTNDYHLILPLMAAVIVSLIVSKRLHPESIYTLKLSRRGIHLRSGRDLDVMETVQVSEVMVKEPVTVPIDLPAAKLADEFLRTGRHGFPVVDRDGSLFGVVSLEDYRRATNGEPASIEKLVVGDIATRDVVSVYADETVGTALRRMAPRDISRLPVVARENPRHLVGVVRRNDIVRAYDVGALRREEARHRVDQLRAISDARTRFMEIRLKAGSYAAGRNVAEIGLPHSAVLVSIRRGRDLLIPHGDTVLQAGDVVTLLCERDHIEEVESILLSGERQEDSEPGADKP